MPGYQLIERKYLHPNRTDGKGVRPNNRGIGFLDFLRELQQDPFPYHDETKLLVIGLEDILLFSRPEMEKTAKEIHRLLQRAARDFESQNCGWVQILIRTELLRGESLNVMHPTATLPIHLIFGSPPPETDKQGNVYYLCKFNLSSVM